MKNVFKPMKCYYCGKTIETYSEHVQKNIPTVRKGKEVFVSRDLHLKCLPKITENVEVGTDEMLRNNNSDWDKTYVQMKKFLDIDNNLPKYAVMRLLGLRVGKFTPKSENVIFRDVGYDFEVIYKTLLFVSGKVQHALNTVKFTDMQHKVNYIMTVVTSNIDFIAKRIEKKRDAERLLDMTEIFDTSEEIEIYVSEEEKMKNKVADKKLAEDQEKGKDDVLDFEQFLK